MMSTTKATEDLITESIINDMPPEMEAVFVSTMKRYVTEMISEMQVLDASLANNEFDTKEAMRRAFQRKDYSFATQAVIDVVHALGSLAAETMAKASEGKE